MLKLFRGKMVSGLVFGKCQSGKTKKIMSVPKNIINIIDSNKPELPDKVLLIGIMQSRSTMSASQFIQRMNQDMCDIFTTKNIVNVNNINTVDINKNTAIITFHDVRNERKILSFLEETSRNWGTIITIIDEVDQGQDSGLFSKLKFLNNLRDKVIDIEPYHLNIFSTATILNFKISFEKIIKKKKNIFIESVFEKKIHLFPVEQSSVYYDINDITKNDNLFIFNFPSKEDLNTDKEGLIKYKENLIFEKIKSIKQEYKKYGIVNISNKIADHKRQCENILNTGFNVSIAVNSEYPDSVNVSYISSINSEKKTFKICLKSLKKDADKGYIRFTEDSVIEDGLIKIRRVLTGINSKSDITVFDIIQAIYLKNDNSSDINMVRNNIISSYISFPDDFPEKLYIAIVGCLCFDRGNTFQNVSTNVLFTMGVQATTSVNDITFGAINYQRFGRVLGNIKNNKNHELVYITESSIIESVFANSSIVDELIKNMKKTNKEKCYISDLCKIDFYIKKREEAKKIYNI